MRFFNKRLCIIIIIIVIIIIFHLKYNLIHHRMLTSKVWTDDSKPLQESNLAASSHAGRSTTSYRQQRVKDLPKVPTWRLETESNQRPSLLNTTTLPTLHLLEAAEICSLSLELGWERLWVGYLGTVLYKFSELVNERAILAYTVVKTNLHISFPTFYIFHTKY